MQQPTLPGCLHEIAPEPRGPGGWLHPDGDEAQVLIRDDCEPEPPLSRLNGMTLRLPVVPLALLRPLWHLRWIMIMSVCAGVTWVPMCLSALVVLSLLALGTVLTVSVDAHSRAKAQLSAKFLVVRTCRFTLMTAAIAAPTLRPGGTGWRLGARGWHEPDRGRSRDGARGERRQTRLCNQHRGQFLCAQLSASSMLFVNTSQKCQHN